MESVGDADGVDSSLTGPIHHVCVGSSVQRRVRRQRLRASPTQQRADLRVTYSTGQQGTGQVAPVGM
eukprot:7378214-Prymnesium_polylepis.2